MRLLGICCVVLSSCWSSGASASDWSRFRGPNGSGVAEDAHPPVTWSETEHLQWKTPLPGPGSSSPIVVGDRVLLTCYSGYGLDRENPGNIADLKRHVVCVDLASGKVLWDKAFSSNAEEDPYKGFITEHGYASNTPVSDGERVYAFLSKAGVIAFDLDGNQLWRTSVGTSSGPQQWGSGASPILFGDWVVVNASDESSSLVALNKTDGNEVWREQSEGIANNWTTPILVEAEGRPELAIGTKAEVWGVNPQTGTLRWRVHKGESVAKCSSLVAAGEVVFSLGSIGDNTIAVRTGGQGDVTDSNVVWSDNLRGGIGSPLLYDGYLYSFSRGVANCVSVATGEDVYRQRYSEARAAGPGPGGADYCSPVLADGRIYLLTRNGNTLVIKAGPEYELLATNSFPSDDSVFNGTPALAGDKMLIRSNKFLYCVGP